VSLFVAGVVNDSGCVVPREAGTNDVSGVYGELAGSAGGSGATGAAVGLD
jgi:hypothetical protein